MRPDECYRLRWEAVNWSNGRNGTILVTHGKTSAARRVLPLTRRTRHVLESRWEAAGYPTEGWVWSAPTQSGHFEKSTLKKQHKKALRLSRVRSFSTASDTPFLLGSENQDAMLGRWRGSPVTAR